MAKIGDLQVGTIKIKNGAVTDWFYPVSNVISVTNDSGNPTLIWFSNTSGVSSIMRGSFGSELAVVEGPERAVAFDEFPASPESYYVSSGAATLIAAKVRKK